MRKLNDSFSSVAIASCESSTWSPSTFWSSTSGVKTRQLRSQAGVRTDEPSKPPNPSSAASASSPSFPENPDPRDPERLRRLSLSTTKGSDSSGEGKEIAPPDGSVERDASIASLARGSDEVSVVGCEVGSGKMSTLKGTSGSPAAASLIAASFQGCCEFLWLPAPVLPTPIRPCSTSCRRHQREATARTAKTYVLPDPGIVVHASHIQAVESCRRAKVRSARRPESTNDSRTSISPPPKSP